MTRGPFLPLGGRLRRALDLAEMRLHAISPAAESARRLCDHVNEAFARSPATRHWTVGRAELEAGLTRDTRFQAAGSEWLPSAGRRSFENGQVHEVALEPVPVQALRPGIDLSLYRWQQEALDAWNAAGRRGIIEAVTASGKTRVAEAALAQHLSIDGTRAAVIVPTVELANQWLRRLHALFSLPVALVGDLETGEFATNSILVYIARTAADDLPGRIRRLAPEISVLLVADECHRYGSETYSRALDAPFSATLGLSATPERAHDDGMAQFVVPRLGPVVFTYDHDRGIQEGVISNFTTCFVGVDFAPIERGEHERLTRELTAAHRSLTEQFDFLRTAPSFIAAVRQLAQRDEEGLAAHYLKIAGERRRVVTSAHARHEVVAWLAERGAFAGARTLFFHESIADSEYVASTLQDHGVHAAAHHSQLDRDARRARLAQFERGELEAVVAPRTLDEGIDVPDASLAVIIAGTRVRRQTIQRIGRVLRRADGKHTANVVIIYVRGSGDDPRSRNAPDGARELLQRPSTITRLWPSEAEDLLRFVVG